MKKIIPLVILILTGLLVLVGYFFQSQLSPVLSVMISWGLALIGIMGILGIFYLVRMHFMRLVKREKGRLFSLIFLVMFIISGLMGFVVSLKSDFYRDLILNVQIPVEASLLGILAVTLIYTSIRLIRTKGWTPLSVGFVVSALMTLFLNLGFVRFSEGSIAAILIGIFQRLQVAGARGLLLGMAIGGLIVGLRFLLTIDQPFGEK
jgi:hypothetical protein